VNWGGLFGGKRRTPGRGKDDGESESRERGNRGESFRVHEEGENPIPTQGARRNGGGKLEVDLSG